MEAQSEVRHPTDAQIHTDLLDQHGVVGRGQLLDMGMGRGAIAERLRRGFLHEVFRGVYVLGARRISQKGRWIAASSLAESTQC